jgi:hypothetical protein
VSKSTQSYISRCNAKASKNPTSFCNFATKMGASEDTNSRSGSFSDRQWPERPFPRDSRVERQQKVIYMEVGMGETGDCRK